MPPGSAGKTVSGVVTVVQEHRFKLMGDDGTARLFVLAHDAPLEGEDLQLLQRSQAHVAVSYADADGVIAGVAYDIVPPTVDGSRRRRCSRARHDRAAGRRTGRGERSIGR